MSELPAGQSPDPEFHETRHSGSWQKLSRWSILHHMAARLEGIITGALAIFTANFLAIGEMSIYVWWLAALVITVIILSSFLAYWYFSFQFIDDAVQTKRGVLFKKQLNLKYRRIQNIHIRHPFYFRPLGLVTLKIDGAGSKNEEVYLSALSLQSAEAIKQYIRRKKATDAIDQISPTDAQAPDDADAEIAFYTRSFPDLVIHGLTNNRVWLILGGFLAMFTYSPYTYNDVLQWVSSQVSSVIGDLSIAVIIALLLISIVLAVFLAALLSVLGSIVTYYNFTLFRSAETLMLHCGMINKQEISVQKSRVQTVYIKQDWLDRLLGRCNVILEQISLDPKKRSSAVSGKKILIPSVKKNELSMLVEEIIPLQEQVTNLNFTPISKRFFYKYALLFSALYLFLATIAYNLDQLPGYYSALFIVPALIHAGALYMAWKRAGLAINHNIIIVRKGIIGIDYVIFPAFKIQAISHVQSVLMKRRQLSHIEFNLASRTVGTAYLKTSHVKETIDRCVFLAESTRKSYM